MNLNKQLYVRTVSDKNSQYLIIEVEQNQSFMFGGKLVRVRIKG